MALKPIVVMYDSKNFATGLAATIKGQVYLNHAGSTSSVAVGGSAIAFTELDSTNAPGVYTASISAATQAGWSAVAGDYIEIEIDCSSVGKSAPASFKYLVTAISTDDIDAKLGSPAGASVSADIAAVKSDTAAIKVDLESGPNSLANILSGINDIKNNAGFAVSVPAELVIPSSGTNLYEIPLNVYDSNNDLIDPDSSIIQVGLLKQNGLDRGSLLTGNTPAVAEVTNVTAVADVAGSLQSKHFLLNEASPGVGAYLWFNVSGGGTDPGPFGSRTSVMVAISTGASANTVASAINTAVNGLTGRFSSSVSTNTATVTNTVAGDSVDDTAGDTGFTVTPTTQGVNAYVNMTRKALGDYVVEVGIPSTEPEEELRFSFNYAIGGKSTIRRSVTQVVTDAATSGFALQSTLLATQTTVNAIDAVVTDGTFGNAAIQTELAALQTDITNNVEGASFDNSLDSLHQISVYMRANLFSGGKAV